jgi:hypothetical protein
MNENAQNELHSSADYQKALHDHEKWVHEQKMGDARRAHDNHHSFFNAMGEAAIKSSELTLRTSVIINGGAAISVLAFIGGLVGHGKIAVGDLGPIAESLSMFAFGVAAATFAIGLSYLVHYLTQAISNSQSLNWEAPFISNGSHTKALIRTRHVVHVIAILVGLTSIVLFVCGMIEVRNAVLNLQS